LRFATGIILLVALYFVYSSVKTLGYGKFFHDQITLTPLSTWLNVLYILVALFTLAVSPRALERSKINFPEFYPLLLLATTGMMFMTSGYDLIVIFIGLEILSVSLYVMIGMARNNLSALEATLKYFLLGSFTSGFMLMGIAFLFGGSGSTNLEVALLPLSGNGYESNYTSIGLAFFLVGVFFKMALVPFHSWTPDVYEGSLTSITGFMASGPKSAAMGLLLVLFLQIPFGAQTYFWFYLLTIIAGLSMTVGNIIALRQNNPKRMLAYSSIAHAGYVTAGIVAGANLEALYYLFIYSFMTLSAFALISYLEDGERQIDLDTLGNFSTNRPFIAAGLTLVFLSMAGLPPLGGFWAKLFLFQRLAETGETIHLILLVVGVVNSALAFFYYMKVEIFSYMHTEKGILANPQLKIAPSLGSIIAITLGLVVALLGWVLFQPASFI